MNNIGTIIVTIFLALIIAGIIFSMIKNKKKGISLCGGNCAYCKACTGNREVQKGVNDK